MSREQEKVRELISNGKTIPFPHAGRRTPEEVHAIMAEINLELVGPKRRENSPIDMGLNDWPDPIDIMSDLGAPEFTAEEVPAVLAEFALAYSSATGFDPSLCLSAAVSVAAAALSDDFQIVADSDSKWFQQARLWILAIARPGAGKSPVQKAMLSPLWEVQRQLTAEHDLTVATLPEGEKAPPIPRIIIGDATIEALSERLRGNPRGVLLATDEFESWLGSLDAYRSGGAASRDRGEWLRLFDGGPHTVERVTRGSVHVPNWGASILTATTPAALKKLTKSLPEDGLLSRFIPIIARRKAEARPGVSMHITREKYCETIKRLFQASPRAHNGVVSLSGEAKEFFGEWLKRNQLAAEAFGALEPALESHLAKYPSFILRLALTFHGAQIVNMDQEQARDPAAFPVSLATMQTAAAFLKKSTRHAVALYLGRAGSEVYELTRDTARLILAKNWTMVARRQLVQQGRAFRGAADYLQEASLRLFVDIGWLRAAESAYLKPTPANYQVNPMLQSKFAVVAKIERERRAVIREVISESVQERRLDA